MQKFEVGVGAILTQNTAWTQVEKALAELIRNRCLSPSRLAAVRLSRLYGWIRSSGYFRQKAKRLKNFSRYLEKNWRGRLDRFLDRPASSVREELLSLDGIGPETADSILLYAGRHPLFVVDAYTRRMGQRFGLFQKDGYPLVQRYFMTRMRPSPYVYREYHALLVQLAKRHCRARPLCAPCPLRSRCAAGKKEGLHGDR